MRAKLKNLTDVIYTYCRETDMREMFRHGHNQRHWQLAYRGMTLWVTEFYFGKEVKIELAKNRQRQIIDPDLFKVVSARGNTLFKAWREWFEWIEEDLPDEDVPEPETVLVVDNDEPVVEIVQTRQPNPDDDVWKLDDVFVKDPNQIPEWVVEAEASRKVLWEPPKVVPTNLNSLTWDELFDL